MAAHRETFGTTADGETVYRVRLTGGGLTANVMTWGSVIQDLRLEGHPPPLVLGFERFEHYPAHSPYFGAVAGRCANRIGHGRFTIDGKQHQTERNFQETHTLHGGSVGCGKRVWQIADLGTSHVTLTLEDPDGWMGFPGTCHHTCSYTLKDDATLEIVLASRTDAPTLVNLAPHSYFNLDGSDDTADHVFQADADRYTVVDHEFIPTGEAAPVEGTAFDFRTARRIGSDPAIDHNLCLADARRPLRDVARLTGSDGAVSMVIATSEPGLQIYAGHKIATPVPGLTGKPYGPRAGIALEPQVWPDAVNHEGFPNAVLRPGEDLRQVSTFRFERG